MELLAAAGLVKRGDVHLLIRFDEFSLNAEISYSGQKFRIPDRQPDFVQIPDDPESHYQLAVFLACMYADKISTHTVNGMQQICMHFEHCEYSMLMENHILARSGFL
ncbi:MAG: hypothetical protein ACOCX8_02975, partial [Bacteroidota bacterium]